MFPAMDIDGTEYLEKYAFSLIPGTGPYKIEDKNIKNQDINYEKNKLAKPNSFAENQKFIQQQQ